MRIIHSATARAAGTASPMPRPSTGRSPRVRCTERPGRGMTGSSPRPVAPAPAGRRERGMVTVELAVSILTAALIVAALCWVIGVVGTQIRCQDSAMAIARQLARGDEAGAQRARASVPSGSSVQVSYDGDVVQVVVDDELSWGRLGPVAVSGRATVTREPHAAGQRP